MLGLIAGGGELPLYFCKNARKAGEKVITIAIKNEADNALAKYSKELFWYDIGDFGKAIRLFKEKGVKKACIIGKVRKVRLFAALKPDMRLFKLIMSQKSKKDATLIGAVIKEFEKEGIKILPMTLYLKPLLAKKGVITKRKPCKAELLDIKYGFAAAKKLADADIGQTVIVKNGKTVYREGKEGTDAAIKKGGALAKEGAVCVKAARTGQDFRIDVPGVGVKTVKEMAKANIKCLALEAGKMFLIDKEKIKKEADKRGICVAVL
ncbi:MAG: UDP-2,3-diacylglucosamine diphosphatase LpxI [Candidatus Firestonebacteria bacterium]|nr:UDP-2,3-diacylglucosamine diphosphatase LpxI [Candidatus Firestonebacteria bacterium]